LYLDDVGWLNVSLLHESFQRIGAMPKKRKKEDNVAKAADAVVRFGLSKSVEHVSTPVVGPAIGKALGVGTSIAYSHLPNEVKAGAGVGGVLAVNAGTHMIAAGCGGSLVAVIATAPVWMAVGAIVGGALWVFGKLSE
jgi:hypothetical protein